VVEFGHQNPIALGRPLAFLRRRVDPAQDDVEQEDPQIERRVEIGWRPRQAASTDRFPSYLERLSRA